MNKVECGMSVLNLPLAHAAIVRGNVAPWTDKAAKGANNMAKMRTIAVKSDKAKIEALDKIPALQEERKASLIIDIFGKRIVSSFLE